MSVMVTVVRDPLQLFSPGEAYESRDMRAWLREDELPEGLVIAVDDRYFVVADGDLVRCDADGAPLPRRQGRPREMTHLRVLRALAEGLRTDTPPTYEDLSVAVGLSTSSVGYHLRRLDEMGLVIRAGSGRHQGHRCTRLTEEGWERAHELGA